MRRFFPPPLRCAHRWKERAAYALVSLVTLCAPLARFISQQMSTSPLFSKGTRREEGRKSLFPRASYDREQHSYYHGKGEEGSDEWRKRTGREKKGSVSLSLRRPFSTRLVCFSQWLVTNASVSRSSANFFHAFITRLLQAAILPLRYWQRLLINLWSTRTAGACVIHLHTKTWRVSRPDGPPVLGQPVFPIVYRTSVSFAYEMLTLSNRKKTSIVSNRFRLGIFHSPDTVEVFTGITRMLLYHHRPFKMVIFQCVRFHDSSYAV